MELVFLRLLFNTVLSNFTHVLSLILFVYFYETGYHYVALAVLEHSQASLELIEISCLCLPGGEIKGMCHYT